jgi:hypothetical protein
MKLVAERQVDPPLFASTSCTKCKEYITLCCAEITSVLHWNERNVLNLHNKHISMIKIFNSVIAKIVEVQFNTLFSGTQLRQLVAGRNRRFRNYLCPHHQGFDVTGYPRVPSIYLPGHHAHG